MSLADAGRGRCEILWVVDSCVPDSALMVHLLNRFGTCVDIAGLSLDDAAAAIALHEPVAILTLADDCLVVTSELAQRLGLAFSSPAVARVFTDKRKQRLALARGGLEVPRQWVIDPGEPAIFEEIENEAVFPTVLKPLHGEGSRDTLLAASLEELRSIWHSEGFDSASRIFVLEEYIPDSDLPLGGEEFGGYVSVESVVVDGSVHHLAINGRLPPAFPFRETGFFIPAELSDELSLRVLHLAERAANALDVQLGCLHTEIKLTPTGPVVIEVNGRIGGGVPEMLLRATGVDIFALAFDLALGMAEPPAMLVAGKLAYLFYVQAPPEMTHVIAVEGLDQLRGTPGVEEVILNRGPGSDVSWRFGNHGHVYSVFGTCGDHDDLRRMVRLISQLVRIDGT